jgi:hypothetical protein
MQFNHITPMEHHGHENSSGTTIVDVDATDPAELAAQANNALLELVVTHGLTFEAATTMIQAHLANQANTSYQIRNRIAAIAEGYDGSTDWA